MKPKTSNLNGSYLTTADGRRFFRDKETGMIYWEVDGKLIECSDLTDDVRHLFNSAYPIIKLMEIMYEPD